MPRPPKYPQYQAQGQNSRLIFSPVPLSTAQVNIAPHPGPQTQALLRSERELLYGGARGGGKLQPLDSKVLTPFGFKRMGDIEVGDSVSDPSTGGVAKVIQIFPQGKQEIWKFTFDDGAEVESGLDHLWLYRKSNHQRPNTKPSEQRDFAQRVLGAEPQLSRFDRYWVGDTREILAEVEKGNSVRIPLSEPLAMTNLSRCADGVDPYLLGVLLGDGCSNNISITSCDNEVREMLIEAGFNAQKDVHSDGIPKTYLAVGEIKKRLTAWLNNHKLKQCRSWEKFIPDYVHLAGIEYRLSFLQGLMDTDGTIDERGRVYFCSTSEALAKGVRDLARSLGGKARIRPRQTQYSYLGELKDGRPSWQVRIWLPRLSVLFRIERKKLRATDSWNGGAELSRELVKVERVGEKESQCIMLDSPRHLYVTNDYVVTHNSYCGYFFLMKGNPDQPQDGKVLCNISYTLHPGYRALVLRRNYVDLQDWVSGAIRFYAQLPEDQRPTYNKSDKVFQWPSGAVFVVSHLDDAESFLKYRGHQYQRLLLEEASLIPDENLYIEVLTSIRSAYPELRPQAMLNTNPDGPGLPWVKARFIVDPVTGGKRPAGVPFTIPMKTDQGVVQLSRIFIPALLKDNPTLMKGDPTYLASLMNMPSEAKKKAYIYGDWDAMNGGVYFEEFRRNRVEGEPLEAVHCVKSHEVPMEKWFNRWWSMDWGFDHPSIFLEFTRQEDEERLYVTKELRFRKTPTRVMGQEWASTVAVGLNPGMIMTLWVSHDMYRKYTPGEPSGESELELLMAGVEAVLGPQTVQILDEKMPMEELELRKGTMVILRKAPSQRVPGWGMVVDLLSWQGLKKEPVPYNYDYAMRLAQEDSLKYLDYMNQVWKEREKPIGLPKLRFFVDKTPMLVAGIERAVRDPGGEDVLKTDANSETGIGGDDEIDALRYGVMGWARSAAQVPKEVELRRKIASIEQARGCRFVPGELAQIAILEEERGRDKGWDRMWVPRGARGRLLQAVGDKRGGIPDLPPVAPMIQ